LVYGHPGPNLHRARSHQFRADELHELAEGHHQPAVLMQKCRSIRQLDAVVAVEAERADDAVGEPQHGRAAAGAGGIEKIDDLLQGDGRGHGNAGGVEVRQRGADAARSSHHAGNTEGDIVGALVAHHLERQAGAGKTFESWRAVGIHEPPGERGQEAGRGGAEADADDIDIHGLALDGRRGHAG
jgi:hypothetical protein